MLVKLKHEMLLFHHKQYELNLVQLHWIKNNVQYCLIVCHYDDFESKEYATRKKAWFQIQFFEKKIIAMTVIYCRER